MTQSRDLWGLSTLHRVWKNNFKNFPHEDYKIWEQIMITLRVLLTFYFSDRVDRNVMGAVNLLQMLESLGLD